MKRSLIDDETMADIVGAKNYYEKLLVERFKVPFARFSLSSTKKGEKNLGLFFSIVKNCRKLGVNPQVFLEAMCQPVSGSTYYPYLSYLASEKAMEIFVSRMKKKKRMMLSPDIKTTEKLVLKEGLENMERFFKNCFYNGFPLAKKFFEKGNSVTETEHFLFFLAFPEIFTKEFIILHSKFPSLRRKISESKNISDEEREEVLAVLQFCQPRLKEIDENFQLKIKLAKARHKVSVEEKSTLVSFGNWGSEEERIWEKLI